MRVCSARARRFFWRAGTPFCLLRKRGHLDSNREYLRASARHTRLRYAPACTCACCHLEHVVRSVSLRSDNHPPVHSDEFASHCSFVADTQGVSALRRLTPI